MESVYVSIAVGIRPQNYSMVIKMESKNEKSKWFIHVTPKPGTCDDGAEHDFQGWRDFPDGNGGERVCTKCGLGAMAYTLMVGP